MSIRFEQVGNVATLARGQIVQNKGTGQSYVIVDDANEYPIGVRSMEITNASEWLLVVDDPDCHDDGALKMKLA